LTSGIARRPQPARRAIAAALAALAPALVLGACDSGGSKKTERTPEAPPARAVTAPPARSFLEQLIPPQGGVLASARVPGQIRRLVARLPLERKVAQLLLVGFEGSDASAPFFDRLRRMDLGGVVIQRRNYAGEASLTALTDAVANAVAGRAHQPPFVVAPQEGGEFSAFPDLPPPSAAGELGNVADAASEARRAARTLKRLGLNGVLAPDADVGASAPDPLGPRAYADDPVQVSSYATAVVAAYRRERMLSAPSHFPGIGAAAQTTDEGPTSVGLSMRELERRDLRPFRAVIRAGAPAILVGHAAYAPDSFVLPASLSRAIETNLLRGGLGFRGIAITDDLQAGAIVAGNTVAKAAVQAVQAGADMVWISGPEADWASAYNALLAAVTTRSIPLTRLNAAVTRIVTVKRELGLRVRRTPVTVPPTVPPTAPAAPGTTTPGTTPAAPAPATTTP
jgi:beta-N-acetylhexosaminidase